MIVQSHIVSDTFNGHRRILVEEFEDHLSNIYGRVFYATEVVDAAIILAQHKEELEQQLAAEEIERNLQEVLS